MWDSIRNLRTCEIELKDDLGGAEREWLIKEMLLKDGIECALYHPAGSRCLIVQYDADVTSPLHMVDFLAFCGVHSQSSPLLEAESERALQNGHSAHVLQNGHDENGHGRAGANGHPRAAQPGQARSVRAGHSGPNATLRNGRASRRTGPPSRAVQ